MCWHNFVHTIIQKLFPIQFLAYCKRTQWLYLKENEVAAGPAVKMDYSVKSSYLINFCFQIVPVVLNELRTCTQFKECVTPAQAYEYIIPNKPRIRNTVIIVIVHCLHCTIWIG